MSVKTLMPPGAVKPADCVQRPLEQVLISVNMVVVAKHASGNEVANPNTEIEEGSSELSVASKEENSNDAEGCEDYCQD